MSAKLIVGLGNPGKKYQHTRHNVGFRVVDALAAELGLRFELKKKLQSEVTKNSRIILAKPQTYMNESGLAVKKIQSDFRLPTSDILVIHDEIDLPFGTIRESKNSGAAGHNGVESIIQSVGRAFSRVRIGIENRKKYRLPETEKYVLMNFSPEEEQKLIKQIIPGALDRITKNSVLLPTNERKPVLDKPILT